MKKLYILKMDKNLTINMPASLNYSLYVNAAIEGETSAWNKLYHKYYPGAYAAALRICKDNQAAADAVQDAFMTAFVKLSQLKDPNSFGSWLRQIVNHSCLRALSQNRKTIKINNSLLETDVFFYDEISKRYDQMATESRLYSAMASLPEVLHSTLVLRYFSNFQSYEEIAKILSIPVGTVRSRLNQARLKLGEMWKKHEDATADDFRENNEWNDFYLYTYGSMHEHDACRKQFIGHLKDSRVTLANGQNFIGGGVIEKMVADDQHVGSWLKPVTVFSSGAISIIEAVHFNSGEHPFHCPAQSVAVLYRNKGKANKMHMYTSPQ
jgi:RNA polymerase sigma factor (sigma-70 family)